MSETLRRIAEARRRGVDPFAQQAPAPQQQAPKGWMEQYQQGQPSAPLPPFDSQKAADAVLSATSDMQRGIEEETARQQAAAKAEADARDAAERQEMQQRMAGYETQVAQEKAAKEEAAKQAHNSQQWMNQRAADIPPPAAPEPQFEADPFEAYNQQDITEKVKQESAARLRDGSATTGSEYGGASGVAAQGLEARPMPVRPAVPPAGGFAGDAGRRRGAADQRRANSNRQNRGGWGDAAEAPLPGEETLPASVAQWNQNRTAAGVSGGMSQLKSAYDVAERNVPSGRTFEEWLSANGVRPDTPPMEAQARMEEIVAKHLTQYPNHDPLMEGLGDDPRIDKNDDTILQGRRGVADNTPLDLMTPEQRQKIGTSLDGVPRTARGGYHVWDETVGEIGGYVPRGFDVASANKAMEGGNVRAAADALGIDHTAYGDNMPQLQADVARVLKRQNELAVNYDTKAVPGGGLRLLRNSRMQGKMDDMRANQWAQTMARRYARELKDDGVSIGDLHQMYRSHLARNPGDYTGAGASLNDAYISGLKARQTQNRWLAVHQSADQYNRSRRFGVSQGTVAFFDSLQNAKSPEERANVLMLAHASQPGMGWDRMAAMLTKGEIDHDAMTAWAANMKQNQNPSEKIAETVNGFSDAPLGMALRAQMDAHVAAMPGSDKLNPQQKKAMVRQYATAPIQQAVAAGNINTPDAITFIRSVTEDTPGIPADAEVFATVTGVQRNDPRFIPLYQHVFGTPPVDGFFKNFTNAVGYGLGAAAGAITGGINMITNSGRGIDPSAWAGQPSDPAGR